MSPPVGASMLGDGERYKFMDTPMANYATSPQDTVLLDGRPVGISYYPVYTVHLNAWFSLAAIDADLAVDGQELTLIWGEPDGGFGQANGRTACSKGNPRDRRFASDQAGLTAPRRDGGLPAIANLAKGRQCGRGDRRGRLFSNLEEDPRWIRSISVEGKNLIARLGIIPHTQ